jgi:hypothetical protein
MKGVEGTFLFVNQFWIASRFVYGFCETMAGLLSMGIIPESY